MGKRFWTVRAAAGRPKVGEVLLYGPIGSSTWLGDEVTPKQFDADLRDLGEVDTIELRINSEGGDVFAAQAIYTMLRRHPAAVHTFVDGLAASAASLVAMAGDTITMPLNAMLMLHSPWAMAAGNANDFRQMAADLDKIRESMIAVYSARSGKSAEDIVAILDAETWYTAEEAVAAGFADEVEGEKRVAASLNGATLTINGREVDLAPFRAFPANKVGDSPTVHVVSSTTYTLPDGTTATADFVVVEQEPTETQTEAAAETEASVPAAEAAPAQDEKQARLRLLRLRART